MNRREGLRSKSNENWQAARDCEDRLQFNAATSRYYYSLYEAARFWLDKEGTLQFDVSIRDDLHVTIANIIGTQIAENGRKFREVLNELKELRVVADYRVESVDEDEMRKVTEDAVEVRAFFLA